MPTLDPGFLATLYASGAFPMAHPDGSIWIHHPDPRAIIPLDGFHVSHTLRQTIRQGRHELTVNREYDAVMRACAAREETWISDDIIASYTGLHHIGLAHSVEVWQDAEMVGGLYGVALGGAFFGESMFSVRRDASKIALCALVGIMRQKGMVLLDTQYITPHLAGFGATEIADTEYMQRLDAALEMAVSFLPVPDAPFAAFPWWCENDEGRPRGLPSEW